MTALEHLTSVDRELTAAFYLAARALSWPAGLPRPTDEDLDACDLLAADLPCGRCGVEPAQHFPEITAEQAAAANAANAAKPSTGIFGRRRVLPRAAYTVPERSACFCHHPGAMCPVYEAMLTRWPQQHALQAAYNLASGLLPEQLGDLISARWIDREAVLAMLGRKTAVEDRNGKPVTGEGEMWCDTEPRADGTLHFGDGTEEGSVPAADQRLQRLLLALVDESTGIRYHDLATAWASHDQAPPLRDQTLAKYARDLRAIFPEGMRRRLVVSKWGCILQKEASVSVRASAQVSAEPG